MLSTVFLLYSKSLQEQKQQPQNSKEPDAKVRVEQRATIRKVELSKLSDDRSQCPVVPAPRSYKRGSDDFSDILQVDNQYCAPELDEHFDKKDNNPWDSAPFQMDFRPDTWASGWVKLPR